LTPFNELPLTNDDLVKRWKADDTCAEFCKRIKLLAKDVRIYYVWGNHDHDIDQKSIDQMFGAGAVQFVQGNLTVVMNDSKGKKKYRMRFEHGHDHDLFNSYSYGPTTLIEGRPLGYYLARAAASAQVVDSESRLIEAVKWVMTSLPHLMGEGIAAALRLPEVSKAVLKNIFSQAMNQEPIADDQFLLADGKSVSMGTLLDFPLFKRVHEYPGSEGVWDGLLGSIGDLTPWFARWKDAGENVVVMGHTHACKLTKSDIRGVIYANSGGWIDSVSMSYVKINVPCEGHDGDVQVLSQDPTRPVSSPASSPR